MNPTDEAVVLRLLRTAFGASAPRPLTFTDAGQGRGVFSTVVRIELQATSDDVPTHLVAKLPLSGPNGVAAAASGAYRREAHAYRALLNRSPVRTPEALAVLETSGGNAFLLEDLSPLRRVDQLDGLDEADAIAVARSLGSLHRHWSTDIGSLQSAPVRRDVIDSIDPAMIQAGLDALDRGWEEALSAERRRAFTQLADAIGGRTGNALGATDKVTLCHGDPRADNLVFEPDGQAVLFDWQQIMISPGSYDLSWLAATSLAIADRRQFERRVVEAGNGTFTDYRAGFAVPALLVLLLIQRDLRPARLAKIAESSLNRIGQALIDLEVAAHWS